MSLKEVDKILKEAREDGIVGLHLLTDSLTRIYNEKRKEKKKDEKD